ncbi:MAG: hypothetical protein AAGA32_21105, partial [Pseudomonadota bacterium]
MHQNSSRTTRMGGLKVDKRLKTQCKEDDVSRRLRAIPGVGPAIATAMPAFSTAVGSVASGSA